MTTPIDFVNAARAYLGVPFKHQGRSSKSLDCAGLLICAANDCGLATVDISGYSRHPDGRQLKFMLDEHCESIIFKNANIGDIVLFTIEQHPQHLALLTDIGMIHAYLPVGRVVEHSIDDKWRRRVRAAYRLREFAQ